MKSQERREGEAIVIFTATLWLAAVTVIGGGLLAVLAHVTRLDGLLSVVFWVLFACTASASLGYLYRQRRP